MSRRMRFVGPNHPRMGARWTQDAAIDRPADPPRPATPRRCATPSDPDWDEARVGLEPRRRSASGRRRPSGGAPSDVGAAVRFAREDGLRVCVQGTGHNAGRLRRPRRQPADQDRAHARGRDRRRRRGSRGSRPASPGARSSARRPSTASPRSPAPRTTSASSATRSAAASRWLARKHGLAATGSSRSRSSPPTASCAGSPPRATPTLLLGAARRRRELRRRHRDGVRAAADAGGLRRSALLPVRAGAARSSRPGGAGRRPCPTRSPRSAAIAPVPADAEIPEPMRGDSFAVVEAVYLGVGGARRRAAGAAARARTGAGHVRDDRPGGPARRSTWIRRDRSRAMGDHQLLADLDAASLAALVEAVGPGTRLAAGLLRASPPRRRARAAARRAAERSARSMAAS